MTDNLEPRKFFLNCQEGQNGIVQFRYGSEPYQEYEADRYEYDDRDYVYKGIFRADIPTYNAAIDQYGTKQVYVRFEAIGYVDESFIAFPPNSDLAYIAVKAKQVRQGRNISANREHREWLSENHSGYTLIGDAQLANNLRPPASFSFNYEQPLPILRGEADVTFSIYNKDILVFSETRNRSYPAVSTSCKSIIVECPSNTCKVDCGSVYCCYDSDGIAIASFNR